MGANAKLNEMTLGKEAAERLQIKLNADLKHQADMNATLQHDLSIQRYRTQDARLMLDRANKGLDEKEILIHKINKEKHEIEQESGELSRTIEALEGKWTNWTDIHSSCSHTYF